MRLKLLLAGDGGQGIQTIADIICKAAFDAGHYVSLMPNFGLEQRGGVSLAFIQISDKEIGYPKFTKPDILLVMSEQARERTRRYLDIEDITILDIFKCSSILEQKIVSEKSYNLFFLGVLIEKLEKSQIIKTEDAFKLIEEKLSKKPMWDENKKAFFAGTVAPV